MNTTIRGHDLRVTMVMALLAVLLLLTVALVFALRPAPTTSDRDAKPANHAISTGGKGGSISTHDPYLERTLKWSSTWAMAAFAKASWEGERQMNQPAGESGGRRRTMHASMGIVLAPGWL